MEVASERERKKKKIGSSLFLELLLETGQMVVGGVDVLGLGGQVLHAVSKHLGSLSTLGIIDS